MAFEDLGLSEQGMVGRGGFEKAEQARIVQGENQAAGDKEGTQAKLLTRVADPNRLAIQVEADEPSVGPDAIEIVVKKCGRLLSGAKGVCFEFENRLGLPVAESVCHLEHQAAGVVAPGKKDPAAGQDEW